MRFVITTTLAVAVALAACGEDTGTGTITIRVTGEDGAKEGFPVTEGDETIAFADGWTLKFTKYLVSIGNVSLTRYGAATRATVNSPDVVVADLVKGDPEIATFADVAATRWGQFAFEIVAPTAAAKNANGVDPADLDRMVQGGFNYWVEGEATKAGVTYTFAWGWQNPTKNADCTNGDDDKAGLVASENTTTEAEITLHVEHAFWDSLGDEAAELRFDAIAAKADANRHITFDAVATQTLVQPKDADGNVIQDAEGNAISYDPGSAALVENNLRGFVLAAVASQAHLNGEGLCTTTRQ